jgi:hypothetical protein
MYLERQSKRSLQHLLARFVSSRGQLGFTTNVDNDRSGKRPIFSGISKSSTNAPLPLLL